MQYFVTNFGILRKKKQPESHGFRLYEVKISVVGVFQSSSMVI